MKCEKCLNKDECYEKYFHVGQIITLKGRLFRVKSVKPKELRLKLWRKTVNGEKK